MTRTDPSRRKIVPADARPDERRGGTRRARRAAKREAEVAVALEAFLAAGNHLAAVIEEPVAARREAAIQYRLARADLQAIAATERAARAKP